MWQRMPGVAAGSLIMPFAIALVGEAKCKHGTCVLWAVASGLRAITLPWRERYNFLSCRPL